MPSVDIVVNCPVQDSFRVQQVAGMFDVPPGGTPAWSGLRRNCQAWKRHGRSG